MPSFKEYIKIPAPPIEVYRALTNPLSIQLWTGEEAIMSTEEGSEFSLFSGNLVGKNLSFEEGFKIVQEWYFGEQEEESIVTIKLHPHKQGTSMEVNQTNIPEEAIEEFIEGWQNDYLGAIHEFFAE